MSKVSSVRFSDEVAEMASSLASSRGVSVNKLLADLVSEESTRLPSREDPEGVWQADEVCNTSCNTPSEVRLLEFGLNPKDYDPDIDYTRLPDRTLNDRRWMATFRKKKVVIGSTTTKQNHLLWPSSSRDQDVAELVVPPEE